MGHKTNDEDKTRLGKFQINKINLYKNQIPLLNLALI